MDITSPYHWYEFTHAALSPARIFADATRLFYRNPLNPLSQTPLGKNLTASLEVFERVTRRYGKPEFGLDSTFTGAARVKVREEVVWERPFCRLVHFEKALGARAKPGPKVVVVAPMSGHYATLLRGTVEAFLPDHDVYITDWADARMVPLADGRFDLDDYIDYLINIFHFLGGDCHVVAVCQPSVPVLAAVAAMESREDPYVPRTMTLMGGPIDTRENPTAVNELAASHDIDWFRRNVIMRVPFPHPGMMREVYPGFLQLSGFMSMNLDRHVTAHRDLFRHLVDGDGDSADKHREFYDEYLAVMDLTAEFYLQTVETVFIEHALPKGEMYHRGDRIDCSRVRNVALLTVEGERDDISGLGQTKAAHKLCTNLPDEMKMHYVQPRVGHYGVFNGSRFRSEIVPRIADFMRSHQAMAEAARQKRAEPQAPALAEDVTAAPQGTLGFHVSRGLLLDEPQGAADDLTRIRGIGERISTRLNDHGIFHFWQIAELDDATTRSIEAALGMPGKIDRDKWVEQAQALAAENAG
ncbi:polyhydroxyalkanoate depolymerase [Lutibaculum baratangense]|uniref:Intracellular PHB depolymerase n=1 Tax=Lutibaculum baratangense AMV1 TaxID=631454 RepID=V4TI94_9HYPH|nr:polyhydroxyalkanoate depolymerase [Lutibaculum baratangense]ESR25723.1 Intracellular PHB depolymerase [Lutibaculum baratangense AMV1]